MKVGSAQPSKSTDCQMLASSARSAAPSVAHSSLTGDYAGGGESASFALQYDDLTSRGASLAAISGVYSVYPPSQGGPMITLTVNGNALTFATDGGCNGAGTIDVIDPALNMYSWSMLIGACGGAPDQDLAGLAALVDNPRGGFANLLTLYGATAGAELSFEYRGYK